MSETKPHLRAVQAPEGPSPAAEAVREEPPRHQAGIILLAVALSAVLAMMVWMRAQMGTRIEALELEKAQLLETLAEREVAITTQQGVIDAQQQRLDQVSSRVRDVLALLEQPISPTPTEP